MRLPLIGATEAGGACMGISCANHFPLGSHVNEQRDEIVPTGWTGTASLVARLGQVHYVKREPASHTRKGPPLTRPRTLRRRPPGAPPDPPRPLRDHSPPQAPMRGSHAVNDGASGSWRRRVRSGAFEDLPQFDREPLVSPISIRCPKEAETSRQRHFAISRW